MCCRLPIVGVALKEEGLSRLAWEAWLNQPLAMIDMAVLGAMAFPSPSEQWKVWLSQVRSQPGSGHACRGVICAKGMAGWSMAGKGVGLAWA